MEIINDFIKEIKNRIAGIIFAAVIGLLFLFVPRIVHEINGFDAVSFCTKNSYILYGMLGFILGDGISILHYIRKQRKNLQRTTEEDK